VRGSLLGEVVSEPVETFVETITRSGASCLHVPLAVADVRQAELFSDLSDAHGLGEILLVGKDEEDSVAELVLSEHLVELVVCFSDTLTVIAIDDKDKALSVLEVVAPEGTDLILATNIPHSEVDVLVLNSLDVETDGGNGCNNLTELELVKDGGLTSSIKTDHKDTHILLAKETAEEFCKG